MNTKPSIEFLNHSCLIVSDGTTRILCDPWFTGTAFDNGWRLLHEESHDINSLAYDYIWISHEHPDHLSIPTLKTLKSPQKFVYQAGEDKKVRDYLLKNGHQIQEVADQEEIRLGDIRCRLIICEGFDTAMLFTFADGSTFLNVNDAIVEWGDAMDKLKTYASGVDTLAVQSGYANWAGNPGDAQIARYQYEIVEKRIKLLCETLKPKQIILFASFIYYSHADNFFWNEHFWLPEIFKAIEKGFDIEVIVPSPNQLLPVRPQSHTDYTQSNKEAMHFWTDKLKAVSAPKDFDIKPIPREQLESIYSAFYDKLWKDNDHGYAIQHAPHDFPLRVDISDLNQVVELGLLEKKFAPAESSAFDIKISSYTLKILLERGYARGTITINSKIHFHYPTAYKFFVFFFIFYRNNIGRYFRQGDLSWADLKQLEEVMVLRSIFTFHTEMREDFHRFLKTFS